MRRFQFRQANARTFADMDFIDDAFFLNALGRKTREQLEAVLVHTALSLTSVPGATNRKRIEQAVHQALSDLDQDQPAESVSKAVREVMDWVVFRQL